MAQSKFDASTGELLPQKVICNVKHEEETEEMIDKYVNNECNFQIEYDNESNPIFIKKEKEDK